MLGMGSSRVYAITKIRGSAWSREELAALSGLGIALKTYPASSASQLHAERIPDMAEIVAALGHGSFSIEPTLLS